MKKVLLIFIMLLAGAAEAQQQTQSPPPSSQSCGEPRPEVCPMIQAPVCGYTATGEKKTYGNGCMACGDRAVVRHTAGACSP
jgi:hypothetical protein